MWDWVCVCTEKRTRCFSIKTCWGPKELKRESEARMSWLAIRLRCSHRVSLRGLREEKPYTLTTSQTSTVCIIMHYAVQRNRSECSAQTPSELANASGHNTRADVIALAKHLTHWDARWLRRVKLDMDFMHKLTCMYLLERASYRTK